MNATGTPATLLDRERSALDLPVAGLAALAVAFAAFTVPDALLGRVVEATGLPSLLTAAQPPLGSTARMLIAVAGALIAFGAAYALLRWLDRFAARVPSHADAASPVDTDRRGEMPRVHWADAHPDAPPRRPISATRDLGEPAPPSRLAQSRVAPDAEPWGAAPPEPKVEPAPIDPVVAAQPVPPPAPAMPSSPAVPVRATMSPQPVPISASLGDLMARLERGLAQREQGERKAPPSPMPAPAPMVAAAAAGPGASAASPTRKVAERTPSNDRLQSAIDGLRALSAGV